MLYLRLMGRKPIHNVETLQIGQKMEMIGDLKKYAWQYLTNFNSRGTNKYRHVRDGDRVFIERIS